ncbi:hypothetical protein ACIQUU_32025 [Streptomyces sp. NPDC101116]|uniref:hypothetical protein n=1 Tax=Streptomyces sp. NPDC101116 TaxID=3366107 RepID=UPI003803FC2F
MSEKPFYQHVQDHVTDHVLDELIKLADKIKATREVTTTHAESLHSRMETAGYIRRQWKQVEETLPALMAEARRDQWSVEAIANQLGVTESYVYRRLREHTE